MPVKVAIVPAGQWGTALAVPLARRGHEVRLWFRSQRGAEDFQARRENAARLPWVKFPDNVTGTADLSEALDEADMVVLAPASSGLQAICRAVAPLLNRNAILLSAVKALFFDGKDISSPDGAALASGVIAEELPDAARRLAVLSGPNFALEVARELPAGTVVASRDEQVARTVQDVLHTARFRVWISTDVTGVELGGALKNVIAIAAGLSDGLGMGHNARAALITRGLAEIGRLGAAMGADPLTFAGMSGLGDLVLTCTSDLSRNRRAGIAIAQGKTVGEAVAAIGSTVEGIPTTRAAHTLAEKYGVEMPITAEVYRVLYEGERPEVGMERLMTRAPTTER
ncbi:MAG: glycerol-3-phosphate dehydrogenase [Firmicutes bacterium ZCTH02-B6]|nr:MAG: glycerol-3-phosphate dehydrogenase [Firmicutes bacterium ZCTH02-B6]